MYQFSLGDAGEWIVDLTKDGGAISEGTADDENATPDCPKCGSDMTIRRDLDVLDEAGSLVKVHGGAKVSTEHSADEPGFDANSALHTAEKEAIARAAADLVEGGATIGLMAGTTTWRLAGELAMVPNLTVVTNSMRVAEVFNEFKRPDRNIILTGGVRTPSDALVGPIAATALSALHVDTLFIGVHGMGEQAGFTTPNILESDTNRAFIRAAGRKVVLADLHPGRSTTNLVDRIRED